MQLIQFDNHRFVNQTDLSVVLSSPKFKKEEKWLFVTLAKLQSQCNILFTDYIDLVRRQTLAIEKDITIDDVHELCDLHKKMSMQYLDYIKFYWTHEEEIGLIRKVLKDEPYNKVR